MLLLCMVFAGAITTAGQKNEHYNSPLYSPRKYDPAQQTANGIPDPLKKVGIEQKLGEQLPLETKFKDENGNIVALGEYFKSGRPVIVTLVYYDCPMLCNQVLNGLTGSLKGISLDAGKDFDVVAISFDAREFDKPEIARNKKASYMERYGRPGTEQGFHFLTGEQASIDAVTNAIGFTYEWDEASEQFAHASAIMIATPQGVLSKYFYGIDYAPRDVRFGLVESAENKVGGVTDQLLLYCFHYDPSTGKYGLAVLRIMRGAAVATLLGMAAMGFVFWRRNKRKSDGLK
ncbi:MAG: SCO family protein [Acidobacteria bacterium]|nr:SCO family protein [Acidobacteriota bacterium]